MIPLEWQYKIDLEYFWSRQSPESLRRHWAETVRELRHMVADQIVEHGTIYPSHVLAVDALLVYVARCKPRRNRRAP